MPITIRRLLGGLAAPLLVASPMLAQSGDGERLVAVADGVYAALQPADQRFDDSNTMVVVTDRDVVIVDSPANRQRAAEIVEQVAQLSKLPVRLLVNTHWHSDHTASNDVWTAAHPEMSVAGHRSLAADLAERTRPSIDEQIANLETQLPAAEAALAEGKGLRGQDLDSEQQAAQRQAIDGARELLGRLKSVDLVSPDVTYSRRMTLHRDTGDVVLLHFRAHTRGDTVVWLPRQRVLASGDLFDDLPFGGHGYPTSWLAALRELRRLEPRAIVPGHGPVFEGTDRLDLTIELWTTLLEHYGSAAEAGKSFEEAREELDLEALRQRFCGDDPVAERNWRGFLPANEARIWAELQGELTDY